jgi:hypothetical protein
VVCISEESTGAIEEDEACVVVDEAAAEAVVVVIEARELREYLRQNRERLPTTNHPFMVPRYEAVYELWHQPATSCASNTGPHSWASPLRERPWTRKMRMFPVEAAPSDSRQHGPCVLRSSYAQYVKQPTGLFP